MDLTMEYKGAIFSFELFTDKRGNRQLWLDQKDFQEWEKATEWLSVEQKHQEEFEFYTSIQDHLECFGRSYELFIDKWNTPEPNASTLNWYIDDDNEEE